MAQNISLMGATYSDVPAVLLPKATSGMAQFTDVTDTTAAAADVASGKYFYTADGTKTQGTASGGGGEWTTEDIARNLAPNGRIELTGNITIEYYALTRKPITSLFAPNARLSYGACHTCTSLKTAVYKDFGSTDQFRGCTSLEAADCRGGLSANCFYGCTSLTALVIRSAALVSLSNVSAFNNSPFASGKAGGTLYVPAALISSYQSASNWSTILGYPNNQIKSIESTHTDPTAPVDLTTHYIDGTLIPT